MNGTLPPSQSRTRGDYSVPDLISTCCCGLPRDTRPRYPSRKPVTPGGILGSPLLCFNPPSTQREPRCANGKILLSFLMKWIAACTSILAHGLGRGPPEDAPQGPSPTDKAAAFRRRFRFF